MRVKVLSIVSEIVRKLNRLILFEKKTIFPEFSGLPHYFTSMKTHGTQFRFRPAH